METNSFLSVCLYNVSPLGEVLLFCICFLALPVVFLPKNDFYHKISSQATDYAFSQKKPLIASFYYKSRIKR
jgi:hypothetical protein